MGTMGPPPKPPSKPAPLNFNLLDPEIEKKLDPAFVEYYKHKIDIKPAMHQRLIKEVRLNPKAFIPPWQLKGLPNIRISDSSLTRRRIPIRIYDPDSEKFGKGPYGVHINFHGILYFCQMFQNRKANITPQMSQNTKANIT